MNYVCGDNRFEIIERYKNELISATNIESSPDEMAVLDDILFRFWQMGWLKEQKIAMKPKNIDKVGGNCPVCDLRMARSHKYCYQCGQEMDWE